MKKLFLSKPAKIVVDILLILAHILIFLFSKFYGIENVAHYILDSVLISLFLVHAAQNFPRVEPVVVEEE